MREIGMNFASSSACRAPAARSRLPPCRGPRWPPPCGRRGVVAAPRRRRPEPSIAPEEAGPAAGRDSPTRAGSLCIRDWRVPIPRRPRTTWRAGHALSFGATKVGATKGGALAGGGGDPARPGTHRRYRGAARARRPSSLQAPLPRRPDGGLLDGDLYLWLTLARPPEALGWPLKAPCSAERGCHLR
jgi:hypothetical protein